jgi:hypothetical protein
MGECVLIELIALPAEQSRGRSNPRGVGPKAAATPAPAPKLETIWRAHIRSWQTSGLSRSAYCQRHGLALRSFNTWVARLRNTRRHPRKAIHEDTDEAVQT